ncbi:hypothetical protein PATA110615_23720 [Paenibacillus taichungensis]
MVVMVVIMDTEYDSGRFNSKKEAVALPLLFCC